ncbi:hypothetical protein HDU87_002706 [Geranomyces variabilis]|uniref:Uncharacterized protein n=1 Tax=Geranomyces variabilis TaxID=109894 RepID=A0AAD5TTP1_9FUNG|nr:hypothetical protein HDU87_002706 [Geranomyces variabilis]
MEISPQALYTPDFASSPPGHLGLDHRSNDADDEGENDEMLKRDQQLNTDSSSIPPSLADVLRQAADKLATMVTMDEEADNFNNTLPPPPLPAAGSGGGVGADDEMDALLDRREGEDGATSSSESDWGKEVAEDAIARGLNTHPDRPHPHVHRDLSAVSGDLRPDSAYVEQPLARETTARQRPATAPARDTVRWCRYYKGMPKKPFYGPDVKSYPAIDVARPLIVEGNRSGEISMFKLKWKTDLTGKEMVFLSTGQRQELYPMNHALLLRLANPWSEVNNSTMIMSYLQRPARGERRPAPPRPPAPKPAPVVVKKRPQSASPYYARLATPRAIHAYGSFPADFVPHPRRSARSARPLSPERINALATRHRPPVDEVVPVRSIHGPARKIDPAVWDRLSVPRTRVVRRGGAPIQQRPSRPASAPVATTPVASTTAAAEAASRRKPVKVSAPPPKTSVLTGKYSAAAASPAQLPPASSSRRSSRLSTVEDSRDEPAAELLPHVLSEPPTVPASPNSAQRVIRCDSIAEEEDSPEDAPPNVIPRERTSSMHRPSKLRRNVVEQEVVEANTSKLFAEAETGSDESSTRGPSGAPEATRSLSIEQLATDASANMLTQDEAMLLARAAQMPLPSGVTIEQLASRGTGLSQDEEEMLALATYTPLPPSVAASIENLAAANGGQVTREDTLWLARAGKLPLPRSVAASFEQLATRPTDIQIGYREVDAHRQGNNLASTRPPPLTIPTSISTHKPSTATNSPSRSKSQHSLRTTTANDNSTRSSSAMSPARSAGSLLRSPARASAASPTKNKSMLLPSREGLQKKLNEPPLPQVPIRVGSRRTMR